MLEVRFDSNDAAIEGIEANLQFLRHQVRKESRLELHENYRGRRAGSPVVADDLEDDGSIMVKVRDRSWSEPPTSAPPLPEETEFRHVGKAQKLERKSEEYIIEPVSQNTGFQWEKLTSS
jgi:hypothetical protein